VTSGSVTLDGQDVLAMTVDQRAGPACSGDAVPRRGARRLGVELPAHAKTALDGEAPKLRTWVKDVNAALEQLNLDPSFGTARSTRASPVVRRSATRSRSSSC